MKHVATVSTYYPKIIKKLKAKTIDDVFYFFYDFNYFASILY